ncbi:hypothetical protein GC176_11575 [bacterium]|nr:hypothetical protein [bacterium]
MDTAITVALVGGAYALFGAVLGAMVNHYRAGLEERRIDHERQKWILELHAKFEFELHALRINDYPAIFAEMERLSHFRIDAEDAASIRQLAEQLNHWGYGRSGLIMSEQARLALFKLRHKLIEFADGKIKREALMSGERTDLIEWLRRDLNHSESAWRSYPSLLESIIAAANKAGTEKDEAA